MCITNVYKHTKMTKQEIIIKITWLSLDFLFSEYLCTLVYKVYIYSCPALSCTHERTSRIFNPCYSEPF